MTNVFIGGSRSSRLNSDVEQRIDRIMGSRFPVLVGDANGVDKAVQQYLQGKGYDLVEIFCSGGKCRNNLGGWPVRKISTFGKQKNFGFYATKDRVMAEEASVGLMIWDGRSMGTLMNMLRLVRQRKKVVVYIAPREKFVDLASETQAMELVLSYAPDMRQRLENESFAERQTDLTSRQVNLL